MLRLSQHDFLTDLPNRVVLQERLRRGIESALHHGRILAVLSLDLDGFKQINDSLGHAVGDLLLQSVSRQLLGCARSSDTVSRHGGDEFLILLPAISQAREVVAVAQQMLHVIAAPRQLAHRRLAISASVGIAVFPHDGRTCEVLLRHADTALLAAKTGGRGRYCFHAAPFAPFASRASARLSAAAGGPSHA
jgi:diguanylate cyclase (GGDEF)-like protein